MTFVKLRQTLLVLIFGYFQTGDEFLIRGVIAGSNFGYFVKSARSWLLYADINWYASFGSSALIFSKISFAELHDSSVAFGLKDFVKGGEEHMTYYLLLIVLKP